MAGGQGTIRTAAELFAADEAIDEAVCGIRLLDPGETRLKALRAHDPTPTPYFVLEELFKHYSFDKRTRLLDVGCGTGRVLAYFLKAGFPGKATGVELDPLLAATARFWASSHANLSVKEGSVLDLDLEAFTDFYLFNPFDWTVLQEFIAQVETQVRRPCTVVHMSDNGDSWWYMNRAGWTEVASGEFQHFTNERGYPVKVYESPQHYTVWRFEGASA
ncbi:MAG: class I SAM-dependent methyltransferase [Coriobacteriia bacterium]|nr:class I SAM-dependent methyltransferase [Coriobacteriia bacterium]